MSVEQELLVTQGAAMRGMRESGVVLPFPSGNIYRVRTVGAAQLLRRGSLPNVLTSFVIDAIYNGVSAGKIDTFLSLREQTEQALEFLDSLHAVCEEVFIEPRVVKSPEADDEISIDDLSLADQAWAFDLAFGFARELRPFRPQPETHVDSVPQAQDIPQTAE